MCVAIETDSMKVEMSWRVSASAGLIIAAIVTMIDGFHY